MVGVTPEENLSMIEDTARFLTENGMSVFFDAEHFFDGYREDAAYALSTLEAAARGGGDAPFPLRYQRRHAAQRHPRSGA